MLRVRFLKVAAAHLLARYLCGDCQHRHAAAMAVVQTIDQVQIAGAAAAGAHRNLPRKLALRPRRERGGLFVAHVHPRNLPVAANRVGEAVQRIARKTIHTLHTGSGQRVYKYLGDFHCHWMPRELQKRCRSEDIYRTRGEQRHRGEGDGGLHHHGYFCPRGEHR
jgi:hypothetical protein